MTTEQWQEQISSYNLTAHWSLQHPHIHLTNLYIKHYFLQAQLLKSLALWYLNLFTVASNKNNKKSFHFLNQEDSSTLT